MALVTVTTVVALGWRGEPVALGEQRGPGNGVVESEPGTIRSAPSGTTANPAGPSGSSSDAAKPSGTSGTQGTSGPSQTPAGTPSRAGQPPETPGTPSELPPEGTATPSRTAAAPAPPVLRPGDTGEEVTAMQHRLYAIGFYHGYRYTVFDQDTKDALCRFQQWSAVAGEVATDPLGVYGPATRKALERVAGS